MPSALISPSCVFVYGEMDCNKPNSLRVHRNWCFLRSDLSPPCIKITVFRGILGTFTENTLLVEIFFN